MMRGALPTQPFLVGTGRVPMLAFVRGRIGEDVPEDAREPSPVDKGPARCFSIFRLGV